MFMVHIIAPTHRHETFTSLHCLLCISSYQLNTGLSDYGVRQLSVRLYLYIDMTGLQVIVDKQKGFTFMLVLIICR